MKQDLSILKGDEDLTIFYMKNIIRSEKSF